MSETKGIFVRLPKEMVQAVKIDAVRQEKSLWQWMLEATEAKLPPPECKQDKSR